MSDKIQIKKEIERLKQTNGFLPIDNYDLCDAYRARGYQLACDDILQFIDTLQEEPKSEDLEEAAEAFYDHCNVKSSWWDEGILHKMTESKETFIAGAEWQKQQMMKDAVES